MRTHGNLWSVLFGLGAVLALAATQGCGGGGGGGGDADLSAPRVVSAEAVSQDEVLVTFDEAVKSCSARTVNFTITPDLAVTDAGLRNGGTAVWLKTGRQVRDLQYTVEVAREDRNGDGKVDELDECVVDTANNAVDPTRSRATFRGATSADGDGPRVVSAVSTSNTEILVTFSEAVLGGMESAENPSHYKISASLLVPSRTSARVAARATVLVKNAVLLLPERTTIQLVTWPQSDLEYTLTVTDIKDLAGNPIAPAGPFVEPATTKFVGTPPGPGDLTDADLDGVSDAAEQRGWIVTVYQADGAAVQRDVNADPRATDTDGDGVSDKDEWTYLLDPRVADTDGDDLTDFQELNLVFSNPLDQDTDKDGLADGLEFNYFGISPVLADTDGDDLDDYEELYIRGEKYDAKVANLPEITVVYSTAPSVYMVTDQSTTKERSFGTTISESTTVSEEMGKTDSTTNQRTAQHAFEIGHKMGAEASFPDISFKMSAEVSTKYGYTQGTMNQRSVAWSEKQSREAKDAVAEFEEYSETQTVQTSGGRVAGGIKLENSGSVSVTISSIVVNVKVPDWRNPGTYRVLAAIQPELVKSITLGPGDLSHEIFVATGERDLTVAQARELLLNAGSIFFEVSSIAVTDENGRSFTYKTEQTVAQTALIVLDYQGRRPLERYMVATNLVHADARSFEGVRLGDVLDYLGVPVETYPEGGLRSVRGIESVSKQSGAWFVLTSSASLRQEGVGFLDLVLKAGDWVEVAYLSDFDEDGLFTREEYLYGTYDTEVDSDEDGLSDYEETKVGWHVPILAKVVYPNPLNAEDYDRDGLNDPQERALSTDPRDADTDGDGIFDPEDAYPNIPNASPTRFTAGLSEDSDNVVRLTWEIPDEYEGVLILRQPESDIYGRPTHGVLYNPGDEVAGATVVYSGSDLETYDGDLDFRTTYFYRIFPYDGAANYGASAGRTVLTGPGPLPPVVGLTSTVEGEDIRLSWTNPTDTRLAGILILRDTQPISAEPFDGANYSEGTILGSAKVVLVEGGDPAALPTTFLDKGLAKNVTYYYKVFNRDDDFLYSEGARTIATTDDGKTFVTVTFTEVECVSDNDGDGAELHWTTTIRPASGAALFNGEGSKTLDSGERYTLSSAWQKTFEMDNSSKFWVEGWMEEEDDWFRGPDDQMGSDSHDWTFNTQTYRWESFSDTTRFLNFPNDGLAKIHYNAVTADSTLLVEPVSPNIPAGGVYPGAINHPVHRVDWKTGLGTIDVSGFRIALVTGPAAVQSSDIVNLRVWADVGTVVGHQDSGDVLVATGTWTPSMGAYVADSFTYSIPPNTTRPMLVTADVAATAVPGRILITELLDVDASRGTVAPFPPLQSNPCEILAGSLSVFTPNALPAAADVPEGSTNVVIDQWTWTTNDGPVTVSGVTVSPEPAANMATQTDVPTLKVYEDLGTPGAYDGADVLVASLPWDPALAAYATSALAYSLAPNASVGLLLTMDVAASVTGTPTFQASLDQVTTSVGEVQPFGMITSEVFTLRPGAGP